jgi:curved DNA-binding protein CbpA
MPNPYQILGVSAEAEDIVIESAYRALAKQYHPDAGGDPEKFKQIQKAYQKITSGEVQEKRHAGRKGSGLADFFSTFDQPVDTHTIKGNLDSELIIEGEFLTLALTGLVRADVSDIVFPIQAEEADDTVRWVAFFHAYNNSDQLLKWSLSTETKFIGSDEYSYQHDGDLMIPSKKARIVPSANVDVPSHFESQSAKLEPGVRADGIIVVEMLPPEVTIEEVVYTQSVFAPGSTSGLVREQERFEFTIDESKKKKLKQLPVDGSID